MKDWIPFSIVAWSLLTIAPVAAGEVWDINSQPEWERATAHSEHLTIAKGLATPEQRQSLFRSVIKQFDGQRRAKSLTLQQSSAWDNWSPVANVGPEGTTNAPVFLPVADGDYWYFAAKKGAGRGYHAWRSSDMQQWKHLGKVAKSHWVTTAEYADGKIYLYYDEPNDQDPHLLLGEPLDGGLIWRDLGKVLADPSHGSDAGVIRTGDGIFHLIYEDWSPINARQNSWDSPLAGHADSPDGINGFKPHEHPAPIDQRTKATGRFGTYKHGFTSKEPLRYEIHEPAQDAYGDYTLIQVGTRYYIFCDYDPHDEEMRVGYWWNDSLDSRFSWGGDIGMGFHPDPTIGFAEGQFYLIVQRAKEDFVSPGPWVDKVEARVGVDQQGDGRIDQWTAWHAVREAYNRRDGFARIVDVVPAAMDLSQLPAGQGFCFEIRTDDTTANKAQPILDRVMMAFE